MIELIDKRATISSLGEEPHVWNDEEWELADRNRWRMDVAVIEDAPTIQTCEDAVSRQEAIDALRRDPKGKSSGYSSEDAIVTIGAVPTVQPERKKGKWLLSDEQRREDTDNCNYLFFCSNCLHSDIHAKTQEVPYCWWCGANMRGEQE